MKFSSAVFFFATGLLIASKVISACLKADEIKKHFHYHFFDGIFQQYEQYVKIEVRRNAGTSKCKTKTITCPVMEATTGNMLYKT